MPDIQKANVNPLIKKIIPMETACLNTILDKICLNNCRVLSDNTSKEKGDRHL
ncbi:MAG: hypothetical protein U9R43_12750 [Thermodesulfobacteriota bacterium]|nr:hypothetical protein [Thermodesulfobacteriota bacterium]